jgi:hypothetical protein
MTWFADLSQMRLLPKAVLAFFFFMIMTVFKTYPLIWDFSTHVPGDLGDPLLVTWILAWDFHAFTTDPWNLFNANIFFPTRNTLALSEHLVGLLPLFAPVYALTENPILGYNVVVFLAFALSGIAMFFLVHRWTQHFWTAFLSGFLYAFAPLRFGQIGHLHLLNFYGAPLALLFLDRFLCSKRWRDLAGLAILYWWQVLCSVYLGWFVTIALILYALYYALLIDRSLLRHSIIAKSGTFAALSLLILLPFHLPYYEARQQWGFSRSISECVPFSADALLSYLAVSSSMNDIYLSLFRSASKLSPGPERAVFPGLVLALLAVLGSFPTSCFPLTARLKQVRQIYLLLLILSFILSLGPYLIILAQNTGVPLPYLALYYLAPGFQAMRVPARFAFLCVLAASVLAAIGFMRAANFLSTRARFRKRASSSTQAVLALLGMTLFTVELGLKPLPLARVQTGDEVPEVYRWLAAERLGPIVELPIGVIEDDFRYMYFSTYHWLPIVNGMSGFIPPTYHQLVQGLQTVPTKPVIEFLHAIGVKGLVLHTDRLRRHEVLQWQQAGLAELGLETAAVFGPDVVYKILPLDPPHEVQFELAAPHQLPIAASVRLGLLAKGMDLRLWTYLGLRSEVDVSIEWVDQQTGRSFRQTQPLTSPFMLGAAEVLPATLTVDTPPSAGSFLLSVHVPSLDIHTPPQTVELTTGLLPTSLNAPQLLAAAYVLENTNWQSLIGEPVSIGVGVVNTGQAVWLAHAEGARGEVRLGWGWFKDDQEVPSLAGRELLAYDVFPGQRYAFNLRIPTPTESGQYTLTLELVSENVTWFSSQGMKRLKVPVLMVDSLMPESP